jgi:hypothetical protein
MAPALPVGERKLRQVPVSWAALRQAAACHYLCIRGTEIKAQGCVENLIRAVVAALVLLVLGQDVLDIAPEPLVVGSLASAGILSLACGASTLVGPRK